MHLIKKFLIMSTFIGAVYFVFGSSEAHAQSAASGQITQVEFNAGNPSWPQLMIQLNGNGSVNYFAQQPSPGCSLPTMSADSQKSLQAVAQAAFLAGKNVVVYYNVCGGFNYLTDITMQR
jgi:hypothetical protein